MNGMDTKHLLSPYSKSGQSADFEQIVNVDVDVPASSKIPLAIRRQMIPCHDKMNWLLSLSFIAILIWWPQGAAAQESKLPQETAAQQSELPPPQPVRPGVAEEIAKIKEQWPLEDPASRDFYRHFRLAKAHYQKTVPSLFENDVWPRLVALHAKELLAKERSQSKQRTDSKRSRGAVDSSGSILKSKKNDTDPEEFELGGRYRWVNHRWTLVAKEEGLRKAPLKKVSLEAGVIEVETGWGAFAPRYRLNEDDAIANLRRANSPTFRPLDSESLSSIPCSDTL